MKEYNTPKLLQQLKRAYAERAVQNGFDDVNLYNDELLKIEVQKLKNETVPAVIILNEESRRMQEMYRSYGQQFAGMASMFNDEFTLVLNDNNELIKKLPSLNEDTKKLVINHVYDLAKISHSPLDGEHMSKFIARSNELLKRLV